MRAAAPVEATLTLIERKRWRKPLEKMMMASAWPGEATPTVVEPRRWRRPWVKPMLARGPFVAQPMWGAHRGMARH
jgi:hypothetical protein